MGLGVAVGWFTAAELLLAVWMQTAVPIVVVPLTLLFDVGAIIIVVLVARSIAANLPVAVADGRYVGTDGFARLADKARALLWRPYARLFLLHLGTLGLAWLSGAAGYPLGRR